MAHRALTPGDPLFRQGTESHIVAASVGQARRTVFKSLRLQIGESADYRIAEAQNACHVVHKASNTRISILPANSDTAQGLVHCPLIICDEPAAWKGAGGEAMYDAIATAAGKPNSPLLQLYCGTLAARKLSGESAASATWWRDLVKSGSRPGVHVTKIAGDKDRWDNPYEIRKCNPLLWRYPESRVELFDERDQAWTDTRLKARFLSFRMNIPSADESVVLLTTDDWELVVERPAAGAFGMPVAAVDLGGGRAWSAGVALWPSGRLEACAVAPGQPDLEAQERRDRVRVGTYSDLAAAGVLTVDGERRVPRVEALVDRLLAWQPSVIVCDRFRYAELLDAVDGRCPVKARQTRWSEASEDIRALRRLAADGPLSVANSGTRALMEASLSVATVKNDDQGSVRLVKRGNNNQARDDASAAAVLAAGELLRAPKPGAWFCEVAG